MKNSLIPTVILLAIFFGIGCQKNTERSENRNLVLNGDMRFNQGGNPFYLAPNDGERYSMDQWRIGGMGGGKWLAKQVEVNTGRFQYALRAEVVETRTSAGFDDNHHIEYPIDGLNISGLKWGTPEAKPATLTFWAHYDKGGKKSFAVMNGINSTSFVTTYTATAGIWERHEIHIPAQTDGVWLNTPFSFGIKLLWSLGVGNAYSSFETGAAWQTVPRWNALGSDQMVDESMGSGFYLTGVQLEIGEQATAFSRFSDEEELYHLQKYYLVLPDGSIINNRMGGN